MLYPDLMLFWHCCCCSMDYKVDTSNPIGKGNFSHVYSAVHRQSGKTYAIKRSRLPVSQVSERNVWLAVGLGPGCSLIGGGGGPVAADMTFNFSGDPGSGSGGGAPQHHNLL